MSIAQHFEEKCRKKLTQNVNLILQKLSDPGSIIQVDISGVLKDAASGNFGPLRDYATNYISNNADSILMAALKATGQENSVISALNLFYNMLAQAMSAYNDLVLLYLKKLAENIIHELDKKDKINERLKQTLTNLHNGLKAYSAGDPVFDKYLKDLRAALVELNSGASDVRLVRNTLASSGRFLSKRYRTGKGKVESAVESIRPFADNPYLNSNTKEILNSVGVPTEKEQITNLLAIPTLSKDVITAAKGYGDRVSKINRMLIAYYNGLSALQTGLPPLISGYIVNLFDNVLVKLSDLIGSMALHLNGDPGRVSGPPATYKANPVKVTANAFKWAMDGSLILESFKFIPAGSVVVERQKNAHVLSKSSGLNERLIVHNAGHFSKVNPGDAVEVFSPDALKGLFRVKAISGDKDHLVLDRVINRSNTQYAEVEYEVTSEGIGAFALSLGPVNAYSSSVTALKSLGSKSSGQAALIATEARENSTLFLTQLNNFLVAATFDVARGKVDPANISLCRSFISRCDLVTERSDEIRSRLNAFINTPIPLEDTLKKIQDGLNQALKGMGLDRASDLLESGEYDKFFKLNSKNATYVGAAIEAFAFLRDCFPDTASAAKFSEEESKLRGDQELLNFKITFDFDLAILKNLQDCLDLTALAKDFLSKEYLCGLLQDAGVGSIFNKLEDLLSF